MKKKEENQIIDVDSNDISLVEQEVISSSLYREGENQLIIRVRRTAELISCSSGSPAEGESSDVVLISSDSEDADGLDQLGPRFPEMGQGLVNEKDIPFRIRPRPSTDELADNLINLCPTSPDLLPVPSSSTLGDNLYSSNVAKSRTPFEIHSTAELTGSTSNVSCGDATGCATSPLGKRLLDKLDGSNLEKSDIPFRIRATTELVCNAINERLCDVPNQVTTLSPDSVEESSNPFRKFTTTELASDPNFCGMPVHATTLTEGEKWDNAHPNSRDESCALLRISPRAGLLTKTDDASPHELQACRATTSPGETVKNDSCQNNNGKSGIPFRVRSTTELLEKASAANPCDVPNPVTTLPGGTLQTISARISGKSEIPFRIRATSELISESLNVPSKVQTLGGVAGKVLSSALSRAGQNTNLVTIESTTSSAALCTLEANDPGNSSRMLADWNQCSSALILPDPQPGKLKSPSGPAMSESDQPIDADGNLHASAVELVESAKTSIGQTFRGEVSIGDDMDSHPKPFSTTPCNSVTSKPPSNQAHMDVEAGSSDSISFCNPPITPAPVVGMQSSAKSSAYENISATKLGALLSPSLNEITATSPKRPSHFYTETSSTSPWSIFIANYRSRERDWYLQKDITVQHPNMTPLGHDKFSSALAGPHERTPTDISGSKPSDPRKKSTKRKCVRTQKENEIIDHYNEVTNRLWELNQMKKKTRSGAHCGVKQDVIPDMKLWKQLKKELRCLQVQLQRKLKEERIHKTKGIVGNGLEGPNLVPRKSKEWGQAHKHPQQRKPDQGTRAMFEGDSRICYVTSNGELIGGEIPEPAPRSQTGYLPNLPVPVSEKPDNIMCKELDSVEVIALEHSTSRCGSPMRDEIECVAPKVESLGPSKTYVPLAKDCHKESRIPGNASGFDTNAIVAPCSSSKTSLPNDSTLPLVSSPSVQIPVVDGNVAVSPQRPSDRLAASSPALDSSEASATVLSVTSKNLPTSDVKMVNTDRNVAPPKLPWTALSDTSWDALYR